MLRPIAALAVAAVLATAGPAHADPQYNAHTLPTLSLFNRSGGTAKVEFVENGAVKSVVTLSKTTSYVSIALKGSYTLSGTVDANGKVVPIAPRGVHLEAGKSFNLTVESNGNGGFVFKNGP
ncbi:MAG TPA: hypothetical protein VIG46_11670 [Candidatus Baltobacteraceae bacterium]|jgi:hypothetical protein